jgi:WD40-like Beta Propeller Repeat
MTTKAMAGAIIGLSIAVVVCRPTLAQEGKPDQPAARQPGKPEGRKETPDKEANRLVEGLRQHPVQRAAANDGLGRIYAIDVETAEVTLVADESVRGLTACGSPTWSHDGRRILFDAFPRGAMRLAHLKSIELVAGRPEVADLGPGNCPEFSPDDQRIAFVLKPGAVPDAQGRVWMMQADGSGRHGLGGDGRPRWSPDGHQLMLIGWSTPCEVTLMDAKPEKSGDLQLPGHGIYATPSWAGPGTIVAFIGSEGRGDTMALIDVTKPQEGRVKEVLWKKTRPDLEVVDPVYSTIRRECVFIGSSPEGMALYSVRQGKSEPPRRLEPDDHDPLIWDLAFSPDGRYVLFGSTRPERRRR